MADSAVEGKRKSKKSSSKDVSGDGEAKERRRSDKDEKKEKKSKKDKVDKDAAPSADKKKKSSRPESASKKSPSSTSSKKPVAEQPAARPKPRGPPPPAAEKPSNNYLADFDLPSSDDDGDRETAVVEEKVVEIKVSAKEAKKLADRERQAAERAHRQKQEALQVGDDMVFDVAFMGQDKSGSTLLDANALDVKVADLTMRAKGKLLLDKTNLTITYGRRYGLVGPNGHGKSTLLKMLAARRLPVPDNMDILMVEQEVEAGEVTALTAVIQADLKLMELQAEEAALTAQMEAVDLEEGAGEDAAARLAEVYDEIKDHGGASAEARASKILHGLGFTPTMQTRSTQSFSGGWRMRISLARALYIQPTLLLLDEPTNHLDLRAVLWLEEYLTRYKKTLLVVSHDREFLNAVTTDIIDLHDQALHQYRGNFASFEEMKEQKRAQANKAADKYTKQLKAAKASANREKTKDITNKAAKDAARNANKSSKKGGDQTSSADIASAPKRWSDYSVSFAFEEPTDLGSNQLLQLIDADFKYPGREDFAMSNLNIGVDMGSKVAIVGPNGAGKTTLMNLIAGDLSPTGGEGRRPIKLRIGRYAQHFVDALNMEDTPIEYLLRAHPTSGLTGQDMRGKLGRFGLSGHHHTQPICKLSGGQKARVVYTSICLFNPHILLFDEPTNHLDMQSIDALCDAIEAFEGGVVVISHDAQLLNTLCEDEERSEVWVVDNGTVVKHAGDFQDYKDGLMADIRAELDDDEAEEQ